ncbi:hypothetical protein B0H13DRAFT_2308192 [Mycena leptocephala]|nr:hypothetical protein B0H13DRAFT_2308192 [Mycena leptocephala]
MKIILQWIKRRSAPLHFIHLKKGVANGHLTAALELSATGCGLPCTDTPELDGPPIQPLVEPTLNIEKVTADIPNDSGEPEQAQPVHSRAAYPAAHRGRDRLNDVGERNRASLMEAKSSGKFWKVVKRLSDPAPSAISVTAHDLKDVFEKRLNLPATLPASFDSAQHKMNKILAALISDFTTDSTPEGFFKFPSEFTEENMEWLKDHLRTNSMASASGEDAIVYGDIVDIPNDELTLLFNECIRMNDGPTVTDLSAIDILDTCPRRCRSYRAAHRSLATGAAVPRWIRRRQPSLSAISNIQDRSTPPIVSRKVFPAHSTRLALMVLHFRTTT